MTAAQKDRLKGFNASLKQRGVSVTLQPGDVPLTALVEQVTESTRKRLQIASDLVTDIVHIKRDDLADARLDASAVTTIARNDSSKTFRVEHYEDNPQRPSVLFHCLLA